MAAQPVLMTDEQFQSLGALYERTQVENRQIARLTQAAQSVDRCDGLLAENTRVWLRCLDGWSTEGDVDDTFMITLAKHTTSGELLEEIRRWCNTDITVDSWAGLKAKVQEQFLSACEDLKLQAQLERTTQLHGETVSAYIRRFKGEAQRAYTGDRADTEEFRVVKSFLRGFTDRSFAERVFRKGKTATLTEVADSALELEAEQEKMHQVLQPAGPEAMEVDTVCTGVEAAGVGATRLEKRVDQLVGKRVNQLMEKRVDQRLEKQVDQLSARLSKMEGRNKQKTGPKAAVNNPGRPRQKKKSDKPQAKKSTAGKRPRSDHEWTKDGKPICHFCKKPGHLYRECRSRLNPDKSAAAASAGPQQQPQPQPESWE